MAQKEQQAREDAKDQLVAGQGYLPVRECEEYTDDGKTCRRWKIITPAIQVKESVAKALGYRLDLYTDPDPGDVAPGNEPNLEEIRTYTPSQQGGGGTGAGQFDIGDILSFITNFIQGRGDRQGSGDNSSNDPFIDFNIDRPSDFEIESGEPNIARLKWQASNVNACVAANSWVTGGQDIAILSASAYQGQPLNLEGERVITLPITFDLRVLRTRNGAESIFAASTTVSSTYRQYEITIPDNSIRAGDTISLSLYPFGSNTSVTTTVSEGETGANIVSRLISSAVAVQSAAPASVKKEIFNRFMFSTNGTNLIVKPKIEFKIACRINTGEIIEKNIVLP